MIVSLAMLTLCGCVARTHTVERITDDAGKTALREKEGLLYALPRTVFTVSAEVTRTDTTKAEFAKFTDPDTLVYVHKMARLLGLKIFEGDAKYTFSIGEPALSTAAEQDPDQQFIVEMRNDPTETRALTLVLNKSGVIASGTSNVQDRKMEFAVNTLKAVLSYSALATVGGEQASTTETDIELIDKVVQQIESVRSARIGLLSNGDKGDKEVFDASLAKLDDLESGWAAYFTGVPTVSKAMVAFVIRPVLGDRVNSEKGYALYKFSKEKGIKPVGTLAASIPDSFNEWTSGEPDPNTVKETNFWIRLAPAQQTAVIATANDGQAQIVSAHTSRSFYYRIPAQVMCEIETNKKVTSQTYSQVAQWGAIASLPVQRLAKGLKHDLKWDELTGGLSSVTVESTSYDPEHINTVSGAVNSYVQNTSEKAKLQSEYDVEKLKSDLRTLRRQELSVLSGDDEN